MLLQVSCPALHGLQGSLPLLKGNCGHQSRAHTLQEAVRRW